MPTSLDYQLNWNDRFESGEPVRSYRFNYQLLPSAPPDVGAPQIAGRNAAMNDIVLAPAVKQLELVRTRPDLCG